MQEQGETKLRKSRAVANNLFAMNLLGKICPSMVVHKCISCFLGYFEWLFYSAFFMRYVIDSLSNGDSFRKIMVFVVIVASVEGLMALYDRVLVGRIFPVNQAVINRGLYRKLFRKSRNVELSCFEDSDFYDRYTLAMERADERLITTVEAAFKVAFGAIASICAFKFMYDVDKISVLFVILPVIGNFVFNRRISHLDYARNKDMAPHNRRIAYINRVMYLPEYAKEMRLTGVFALMRKQYREAITGVADVTKKYTKKAAVLHWLYVMFTFTFIFEGLLIYGAYRTLVSRSMTLAQLSVITSMMVSTTWILIGFTESLTALFKNGLFVEYLRTFLEYKERIPEDADGADPGTEIQSIEFKNVSFSYKDKEVIKNLSMEFRGGKTYALVGHNGAGKTTLIKLLLRFYDPTEGQILLNGRDIREYNLRKYRALFATAFQDHRMFSMTVAENVIMGENVPAEEREEKVNEALRLAGAYDKVMSLPKGINTILTREFDDEGAMLSGGEFQKIVVARAFVRECPFKVFDEPSSALDPIAEAQLFDNIYESCRKNTLVFISHRLSSVQNADWVYLLADGTVKEEGTHRKLMEKKGLYADMYTKQAKNYLAVSSDHPAGGGTPAAAPTEGGVFA
ncbi:MAG: ABC transporter ATP-binding protein [Lachnospiraceae bacterium]|nr:ABC transporter ATP-binding protein [Lachnospiraceae bacterium]